VFLVVFCSTVNGNKFACDQRYLKYTPTDCAAHDFIYKIGDSIQYENYNGSGFTSISLINGDVEVIPNELFANNQNIEILGVSNSSLSNIRQEDFQSAKKLMLFWTNMNSFSIISNETFQGAPNLLQITINNELFLTTLEVGAFKGLKKLQRLLITKGAVASLSPGIFDDLIRITEIDISSQKLKDLPIGLFNKNSKLNVISIAGNLLKTILPETFNGPSNLLGLSLSYNQLIRVPPLKAATIYLNDNQLEKVHITENTLIIDLAKNNLNKITCAKNMSGIQRIDISNNKMKGIKCISRMSGLKNLDISDNLFSGFSKARFQKFTKLWYLDVQGNNLKNPRPRIFSDSNSLLSIKIDKMQNYATLRKFFPKLYDIWLSTANWTCNEIERVASVLRPQKITINFNYVNLSSTGLKCRIPYSEFNKNPVN
jgi:Leucine-rich repeat (LRR) protein